MGLFPEGKRGGYRFTFSFWGGPPKRSFQGNFLKFFFSRGDYCMLYVWAGPLKLYYLGGIWWLKNCRNVFPKWKNEKVPHYLHGAETKKFARQTFFWGYFFNFFLNSNKPFFPIKKNFKKRFSPSIKPKIVGWVKGPFSHLLRGFSLFLLFKTKGKPFFKCL